jgi:hypothetical protein
MVTRLSWRAKRDLDHKLSSCRRQMAEVKAGYRDNTVDMMELETTAARRRKSLVGARDRGFRAAIVLYPPISDWMTWPPR